MDEARKISGNAKTSSQEPVDSGFGAGSTADDVIGRINLTGMIAIITGGYSGIGLETTRVLNAAGAKVIIPAHDPEKALISLKGLKGIEIEFMNLMDPVSIDAFANKFLASGQSLNILINCAGIMATPLMRDGRGYEAQFSTNHLGHFQLTARLHLALRQANGARVVAVSSRGHRFSPVIFDDINFEHREYTPWLGYGQSKTANILFALQLDKLVKDENIRAFSVHPGSIVATDLGRYLSKDTYRNMGVIDENGNPVLDALRQLKTVEQGASTIVWCATNPKLKGMGGVYCENNNITKVITDTDPRDPLSGADSKGNFGVMPYAVDPDAAQRLWTTSQQLTINWM